MLSILSLASLASANDWNRDGTVENGNYNMLGAYELDAPEDEAFWVDLSPKPQRQRTPIPSPAQPSSTVALTPSPQATPVPEIELSPAQEEVLEKVKQGKSVFFTGSAGESGSGMRAYLH